MCEDVDRKKNSNSYSADHDYNCRFDFVLLVDQITVFENEMCA